MKIKQNNYLTQCDLISKFNLRNIDKIPAANKIILEFPLKSFLPFYQQYYNYTVMDDNIQLKGALFWYVLLNGFPLIQFQDVKMTKFNRNKIEGDFLLKIVLTNKDEIHDCLSRIFSETVSFSKKSINKNLGREFITHKDSISYNFKISGSFFFDANELFSSKIKNIDLKQVQVATSIHFNNIPRNTNLQTMVKHLSIVVS